MSARDRDAVLDAVATAISGAPFVSASSARKARAVFRALHDAGYVIVPREPTEATLRKGMALAQRVSLSGDYKWLDYMRDMHGTFVAAADIAAPETEGSDG